MPSPIKRIALDTETTGLDPWHGSKPFLVTIADEHDNVHSWEWNVDPQTRQPNVLEQDRLEIVGMVNDCDEVVIQNTKFDVRMLETIGVFSSKSRFPWHKVQDTLIAGHLINSVIPHDLASSALRYLHIDIKPLDDRIREVTITARKEADKLGWRIAKKGDSDMPSAKEKTWKYDLWVPRQLAEHNKLDEDHEWHNVVHAYAYTDPVVTFHLFSALEKLIKERGLERVYQQRLKLLPVIYDMESQGVSYSKERMDSLMEQYKNESASCEISCRNIAKSYGYDLVLPKSGNNKSLTTFVFDVMKLDVIERSKKTGAPSLNKNVLEEYNESLMVRSKQHVFSSRLFAKRKRDTAIQYMQSYATYAFEDQPGWMRLFPSVNLTGTNTLRNSSSNPNEQNISKKEGFNLRYAFGPAPGREWWALDYDNLELRIPAYECQEPAMLELFENSSDPPFYGSYHLLIFSLLYPEIFKEHGTKVKSIYKSTLYQYTKNGNFAELYGAVNRLNGKGTADKAFHYPGAQSIVAAKLKKKAALNQQWIRFAKEHGYVTTMPDKTVDPLHGYPVHCPVSRYGISPTIPLNYHVQGTACWAKLQAMVKVSEYLFELNVKKQSGGYHIVMEVHDEIVFDFPRKADKGNLPKIKKIQKLMESCGDDIGVPLTCGIDYHPDNWSVAV